jgi:hypothetical protein
MLEIFYNILEIEIRSPGYEHDKYWKKKLFFTDFL